MRLLAQVSSSTLNTDVNWCLDFLTQVGMMFSLIDFSVKLGETRFGEWVNCRVTFESLVTGEPLEFDLSSDQTRSQTVVWISHVCLLGWLPLTSSRHRGGIRATLCVWPLGSQVTLGSQ